MRRRPQRADAWGREVEIVGKGRSRKQGPARSDHRARGVWRVLAVVGLAVAPSLSWALGLPAPGRSILVAPPVSPAVADIRHAPAYAPHPARVPAEGNREQRTAASVSVPDTKPGLPGATGVPPIALLAYQRSASVVDAAVASCHLDWTLLAAIGQVESDHGQAGGSHLDDSGVARPPIIGVRLDGRDGTSRVRDTDAGHLDGDAHFDHAVGPMQFLPSTWSAVGVDGDQDGRRRVQDIDDAALGSGVYLCAVGDDLSTLTGERAALLRYNHSTSYVEHVLAVARDIQLSATGVLLDDVPQGGTTPPAAPATSPTLPDANPDDPGRPVATAEILPHATATISPAPLPAPTGPPPVDPPPSPSEGPTLGPTPTPSATSTEPATPEPTTDPSAIPLDEPRVPSTAAPTTDASATTSTTDVPVIPDPLPPELVDFSPEQVTEYGVAWVECAPLDEDSWARDTGGRRALRQCLAGELAISRRDPQLLVLLDWAGRDEGTQTS